ncbi:hypothetical protein [Streptomyces sp. NPDC059708]|uniref:hypothetical protein n=1 Tax=Streptomyces sp. NPDC059708 TaxID=3346916 RepID=UPI0036B20A1B
MAETPEETPTPEAPKAEETPKAPTPAEVFTPEAVKPKKDEPAPEAAGPDHSADIAAMKAQIEELTAANAASAKEKAELERTLMEGAAADKYSLGDEARELLKDVPSEKVEETAKRLAALAQSEPLYGKGGLDPTTPREDSPEDMAARIIAARYSF